MLAESGGIILPLSQSPPKFPSGQRETSSDCDLTSWVSLDLVGILPIPARPGSEPPVATAHWPQRISDWENRWPPVGIGDESLA